MRRCHRWRLFAVKSGGGDPVALFGDAASDSEFDAEVSPDGKRVAYISDRDSEDGDVDLWVAELQPDARGRTQRTRLTRVRGAESSPSWAPDGGRIAYFAAREGLGSVWVDVVRDPSAPATARSGCSRRAERRSGLARAPRASNPCSSRVTAARRRGRRMDAAS